MIKSTYFNDSNVQDFVNWSVVELAKLPIDLQVPQHRRFVPQPGGVHAKLQGIQHVVPKHYVWRAKGMTVGDWPETSALLNQFSQTLRKAVANGKNLDALDACWSIIEWGGGNQTKGAYPYLAGLGTGLCDYIRRNGQLMTLSTADEAQALSQGGAMNSMLTKVHALYSTDGLPIYDSRVAGAVATLVELWRQSKLLSHMPLPLTLSFPAVPERKVPGIPGGRRNVKRRFPHAVGPGQLYHASSAPAWASAKVRLGWVMDEILRKSPALWPGQPQPARMRCLEASLFMVGYDVACL